MTFGDDPLSNNQIQAPVPPLTDTSLKMNQLAAKYLKNGAPTTNIPSPKPTGVPLDMSLATRNYMEKHKIIQQGNYETRCNSIWFCIPSHYIDKK